MAFNGQSKPKSSSQNYTNILYSDSDSDNIPDLKLPPVRGKKLKKRRVLSGKHADSLCNFWTVLKLVTAIVVVLVMAILTAVCFWTFRQLREVQQQIAENDRSEKLTVEVKKLHSQFTILDASILGMKTELEKLSKLTNTVTDVQLKMNKLEASNKKDEQIPGLNDLTSKVEILSKALAKMGSDVLNLNGTQLLQQVEFDNKFAELGIKVNVLDNNLKSYFNNSSKLGLNSSMVTELVSRLLQAEISNITATAKAGVGQISLMDSERFLLFSAETLDNFKEINKTLDTLNNELEEVSNRLDSHDKALTNITAVVKSMKSQRSPLSNVQQETGKGAINNSEGTAVTVASNGDASLEDSQFKDDKRRPIIRIDGINTWDDLKKAFKENWPLINNQLDVDTFNAKHQPGLDKEVLKYYDADKNGHYSEDEMAAALGFHQPR